MKPCAQCQQENPDAARFCQGCGAPFEDAAAAAEPEPAELLTEPELWRAFIGQNADRYLEQFKKFTAGGEPRFALTWHWPAFLFDPFLWFLYRKMYLYAAIYAIGPVLSAALTGDVTVGVVWRIMAGASANYIYYWHVREQLGQVRAKPGLTRTIQEQHVQDLGGVQPYVIWVGALLHAVMLAVLIEAYREGPPEGPPFQKQKPRPGAVRAVSYRPMHAAFHRFHQ
jgi:hypothetical protein